MHKLKILALVDEPYINTYETLYYEAKKSRKYDFNFVCIKNNDKRMGSEKNYELVCNVLRNRGIPYIDGYCPETGKELDLKDLMPDVVLLQTPYDGVKRSELYSSKYLSSFTRVVHISYGSTIIDYDKPPYAESKLIESNAFFGRSWFCAMENPLIAKQFNKYHRKKFKSFGYIKLDKYLNYKDNPDFPLKKRPNFKHIIAWKPRWIVNKEHSNFLTYIDYFKNLTIQNPDILLLFVSHPLLKDRLITTNVYTPQETESLFKFLNTSKNIKLIESDDFLDDIYNADIFVGDYCSTITEAAIFDIPVIYTPTSVVLSEFGEKFIQQAYVAHNPNEMDFFINSILNNKDYNRKNRRQFIDIASPAPNKKSYAMDLLEYMYNSVFCESEKKQYSDPAIQINKNPPL